MDIRFRAPPGTTPDQWGELVKHALEGFARGSWSRYVELRRSGRLSPLVRSDVEFKQDPGYGSGVERFASPEQSDREGWVDCDRAVLWYLLDLWYAGEPATVRTLYSPDHEDMHVVVRRADHSLVDPAEFFL